MSRDGRRSSDPSAESPRILIAGSNLFAGALARTLGTHGFLTTHTAAIAEEIAERLEWEPDLVVVDVRPFNVQAGSAIVRRVHKAGCEICVIDNAADGKRPSAWLRAGSSAVVGEDDPIDQLLRTISRLLRINPPVNASRGPVVPKVEPTEPRRRVPRLELFARLTERERVVLSELMEGHSAEDIATSAFVSISTVRSQIKAILQKLGVNSQLAAVAMARRAGWAPELPAKRTQTPSNQRRHRAS